MHTLSVLIIDDEKRITEEISEYLGNNGYTVFTADRPSTALALLSKKNVDIALVDIKLPEYSGLELIKKMSAINPDTETIVMSGHGDMESVIEAFRLGAFDYLKKPFSVFELQTSIERTKRYFTAQQDARSYAERCASLNRELAGEDPLIGASLPLAEVRTQIQVAAENSSSPVLVLGESGTGKELVARHIHAFSKRGSKRFVAVNCAAIPREMFESEFFGHEKGAFTDAKISREGLFSAADGGTLFLDEVAEIPFDLQAKLLRTIETGTLRAVGSDTEKKVDVRIICATNRDIAQAVSDHCFRSDLYYRLAVIEITLPPLRSRPEDIPVIARHFLTKFSREGSAQPIELSDSLQASLLLHPFPGNVRELRNLMERAAISAKPKGSHFVDSIPGFSPQTINAAIDASSAQTQNVKVDSEHFDLGELNLDALEKKIIQEAIGISGGVLSKASILLGITRQSLDRRMEKHGLR